MLATFVCWDPSLSAGDVIVGAGTLALAGFTWRLGKDTVDLDERSAARERFRSERDIRGVARLVDGELSVCEVSVSQALEDGEWHRVLPTPHRAWDRDGTVLARGLAEDDVGNLIDTFSRVSAWEQMMALSMSTQGSVPLSAGQLEALGELQVFLRATREVLRPRAYPDAREIEADPDWELSYRKRRREQRRAGWRTRLTPPLLRELLDRERRGPTATED